MCLVGAGLGEMQSDDIGLPGGMVSSIHGGEGLVSAQQSCGLETAVPG